MQSARPRATCPFMKRSKKKKQIGGLLEGDFVKLFIYSVLSSEWFLELGSSLLKCFFWSDCEVEF